MDQEEQGRGGTRERAVDQEEQREQGRGGTRERVVEQEEQKEQGRGGTRERVVEQEEQSEVERGKIGSKGGWWKKKRVGSNGRLDSMSARVVEQEECMEGAKGGGTVSRVGVNDVWIEEKRGEWNGARSQGGVEGN